MAVSARVFVKSRDVESKARHYVLWQYGPSFDVGKVEEDKQGYRVTIDAVYHEAVKNAKTSQVRDFLYQFEAISVLTMDRTAKVKEAPSLFGLKDSIISRLRLQEEQVEREVIRAGKRKVGSLLLTRQMFTPLVTIITSLLDSREGSRVSDFPPRYGPQTELLKMAHYVSSKRSREGDVLLPTSKWAALFKESKGDPRLFRSYMLGDVLFEHYDYIVDSLRINQFMPYTRISASYYRPALQFGDSIPIDIPELMDTYFEVYRLSPSRNEGKFLRYLDELDEQEIVRREGNCVLGFDDIFRPLSQSLGSPGGPYVAAGG